MPVPQEQNYLEQAAVLWPVASVDNYGQDTFGSPVEIGVRWNTRQRQAAGPRGIPITTDADAVVARDIAVGSLMWLGSLADWLGTGSTLPETPDLMRVATFSKTPDLKNRDIHRSVGLTYYRSQI